jgi:hypothetical protein
LFAALDAGYRHIDTAEMYENESKQSTIYYLQSKIFRRNRRCSPKILQDRTPDSQGSVHYDKSWQFCDIFESIFVDLVALYSQPAGGSGADVAKIVEGFAN